MRLLKETENCGLEASFYRENSNMKGQEALWLGKEGEKGINEEMSSPTQPLDRLRQLPQAIDFGCHEKAANC